MPTADPQHVIHQLIVGDIAAVGHIIDQAATSDDPTILVAAALFSDGPDTLLARAARVATTTRDRQLVAIAAAHLAGDHDRVDALARDHLVDHPDNVLVAWIAGASHENTAPQTPTSNKGMS